MKRNTKHFANRWIMAVLGMALGAVMAICGATAGPKSETITLANLLDRMHPYSEWKVIGTGRLVNLPSRDEESGRLLARFDVFENLKGDVGIFVVEITSDMQEGPKGSYPQRVPHGAWEVGKEYHFVCSKDRNVFYWAMTPEEWVSRKKYYLALNEEDVERSQRDRAMQEDLDQLREQLKGEQQKGNLTRQEVREKMLERMKYYQDQEEPQTYW